MYKRKSVSKSVSLRWLATPYEGVWALGPEEVPLWDESRGFPREFRGAKLHVVRGEHALEHVPAGEDAVIRAEGDTDLDVLRAWVGAEWSPRPVSTKARDFPWLVRADFTEPQQLADRTEVDVVGELAVLARHYPFSGSGYDKRMLREIAALNATVGQPRGGTNMLRTWLELALTVKAHLEARKALDEAGRDIPLYLDELAEKDATWRDDPAHRRMFSRHWSPYRAMLSMAQNAATRGDVLDAVRGDLEQRFSGTLEGVFLSQGGMVTQSSLWNWTHYRLLEVWGNDAQLKPCAGCGALFFTRRKNQKHCPLRSRCRVSAHEARKAQP